MNVDYIAFEDRKGDRVIGFLFRYYNMKMSVFSTTPGDIVHLHRILYSFENFDERYSKTYELFRTVRSAFCILSPNIPVVLLYFYTLLYNYFHHVNINCRKLKLILMEQLGLQISL